MKRKSSYTEIEKDLAEFDKALKTIGKKADVEKALNNIIENVRFQAAELRKREEELERSRIYFQNFFISSPVSLSLIGLDGTRIDCNPAMEKLTGRSKKELTNVLVEATYAKEEQPLVRRKLVDETIEKGYMYGFETCFMRPDGTKQSIVANCSLLRDEKGKPSAIIYSAADITELQKREEELKEVNAINEFTHKNMPEIYLLTDKEWRVIEVNRAFESIVGYKQEEIIGKTTYEFPAEYKGWRNALWGEEKELKRMEGICAKTPPGGIIHEITQWRTKQGEPRIVDITEIYLPKEISEKIGFVEIGRDITEERNREEELRKREQEEMKAIYAFSKILGKTATGDLSARIDIKGWSEELATVGMAINALIESLEYNEVESKKERIELKKAISNFGSALSKASNGDLTAEVNLSKIGAEYKPIGEDINSTIASFNRMLETIEGASQDVTEKVERMAMASEETGSAIEEITESMNAVAKEAEKQSTAAMNQASAAEETESALEEQTKSSEELSTIGQELLHLSDELMKSLKAFRIKRSKQKFKKGQRKSNK